MKAIDYLEQFQDDKANQYSELTLKSYLSDLKQFHDFIGKDLEDIKRDDIDNFVAHVLSCVNKITSRPYKPQTVNKKLIALRQYIEWINANTDIKIFIEIGMIPDQSATGALLRRCLVKAGVKRIKFHALRHTFASRSISIIIFFGMSLFFMLKRNRSTRPFTAPYGVVCLAGYVTAPYAHIAQITLNSALIPDVYFGVSCCKKSEVL